MKILVLGGTRFFGKRLVERLLESGDRVTIGTRGMTEDPFGSSVSRLKLDRSNEASLRDTVGKEEWDVVFDQICYSPDDAYSACDVFAGKIGKYVYTSSMSVYDFDKSPLKERDFDPYDYPLRSGGREDFSYGEGKRLAEAVFFQKASFPTAAVRFPIVMGTDDYTERLLFHIDHVKKREPIGMPNVNASLSFIGSDEASRFLEWIGKNAFEGPVNACADGDIALNRLLGLIENTVGEKAIVKPT
ncbi:MAG TPA: NAD-dependent epimerase/dehydratase family protein, partial [Bacillales bacterium]|nr:NAD-dependent epimerase/dehydratase family protein [Bacillales bacterium]